MGRGGRNFLRWQQLISKQKDFAVIIYGAGPREQGNRSKSLRNLTTFDPSLLFVLGSVYGTGKLPLSGEFRRRENLCNPADNLTSHTYAGFAGNLTPPATASRRFRRTPPGTRTSTAGWNGRGWGGLMMEGGNSQTSLWATRNTCSGSRSIFPSHNYSVSFCPCPWAHNLCEEQRNINKLKERTDTYSKN